MKQGTASVVKKYEILRITIVKQKAAYIKEEKVESALKFLRQNYSGIYFFDKRRQGKASRT